MEKIDSKHMLVDAMNWRYATKKMNGQSVPSDKLGTILESIRLSASSMGLQPYRVMVVTDAETKMRLQPAAFGQQQIIGSSHLLVFAVHENIGIDQVNNIIDLMAQKRQVSLESLSGYKSMLEKTVLSRSESDLYHWASKQAYIALGSGMVAAALEHVDSTPMEGFDARSFDEILGLHQLGLRSVVLLALGFRDAKNDLNSTKAKVRIPKDDFFIWR